jgi:hypothetical protein
VQLHKTSHSCMLQYGLRGEVTGRGQSNRRIFAFGGAASLCACSMFVATQQSKIQPTSSIRST